MTHCICLKHYTTKHTLWNTVSHNAMLNFIANILQLMRLLSVYSQLMHHTLCSMQVCERTEKEGKYCLCVFLFVCEACDFPLSNPHFWHCSGHKATLLLQRSAPPQHQNGPVTLKHPTELLCCHGLAFGMRWQRVNVHTGTSQHNLAW